MPLPVIDPARYSEQLAAKVHALREQFAEFDAPPPNIFESAPLHYRLRAEFRIWHDGDNIDYVMFDPDAPQIPVRISDFPAGAKCINRLMPMLREKLLASDLLRRKLFTVEFLTTLDEEVLVTLVYHRRIDDEWRHAAEQLQRELDIAIIGRSRGQKIVLRTDYVSERLTVGARQLHYRQIENSFTQPNGGINQKMLSWACSQLQNVRGDLIELYCGNGNFTMALAPLFKRVLATEISKSSVKAAQHNLSVNRIDNVAIVRMSSDEISTALAGGRAFNRLKHLPLDDYRFTTLLVDPPRSGLDDVTLALARRFDNILYISCNPQTLHANIAELNDSHRIAALALFDQFPYTHHLECGVLLHKR